MCAAGGWSSEAACSAWLGLQEAGAAAGPGANLQPLSCLIFPHSSAGQDVHGCIEGLQAAYPHMLVTGETLEWLGWSAGSNGYRS